MPLRDWEDMVYRLALSQTREPADASDVCQETFISLLKDATVFQDDEHLKAWLIRVTINRCNQLRRTASRHRTQPLPDDETLLPKTPPASAALMANEVWRFSTPFRPSIARWCICTMWKGIRPRRSPRSRSVGPRRCEAACVVPAPSSRC